MEKAPLHHFATASRECEVRAREHEIYVSTWLEQRQANTNPSSVSFAISIVKQTQDIGLFEAGFQTESSLRRYEIFTRFCELFILEIARRGECTD